MKSLKHAVGIVILVFVFLFSNRTFCQKRGKDVNRNVKTERNYGNNHLGSNHRSNDRYRIQPVRRNPHYRYPRHRRVVGYLPVNHARIMYRGLSYFYSAGIYYTIYGDEYIVVMPPRGFRIAVLPADHVRIIYGPNVYFYHSGVYYLESESISSENEGKYEVADPPVGVELDTIPNDAKEIYLDGIGYFEYNDVLYKEILNESGRTSYKVVYSSQNQE